MLICKHYLVIIFTQMGLLKGLELSPLPRLEGAGRSRSGHGSNIDNLIPILIKNKSVLSPGIFQIFGSAPSGVII